MGANADDPDVAIPAGRTWGDGGYYLCRQRDLSASIPAARNPIYVAILLSFVGFAIAANGLWFHHVFRAPVRRHRARRNLSDEKIRPDLSRLQSQGSLLALTRNCERTPVPLPSGKQFSLQRFKL